jgi:hypothetical protein
MVVGGCSCDLITHPRFRVVLPRRYFLERNDICIKYCYAPCARTSGERFLATIVAMWALKRAGGGLSEMSVAIRPTIGAPHVSVNLGELTSSTHFGE